MCWVKDAMFGPEEAVIQYHPPASQYVKTHPFCLHMWRPQDGVLPMPPHEYVGGLTPEEDAALALQTPWSGAMP
jgi:hypothetical protein